MAKSIMKAYEKRKWTTALLSGEYVQGVGALRSVPNDNGRPTEYCCLGVAQCAITGRQPKDEASLLRNGRFGLSKKLQNALATANDHGARDEDFQLIGFKTAPVRDTEDPTRFTKKSSFAAIANWIDNNL